MTRYQPELLSRQRRRVISLLVVRPSRGKAGYRSIWLSGTSDPADALEEAQSLVDDPRDTIIRVNLWSDWAEQFVGVVRRAAP